MEALKEVMNELQFKSNFWTVLLPSILMGLDVLTGFINAWAKNQVKSSIMRQGLARKFGELVILAIGQLFLYGAGLPVYCVSFISFYIVLMELISIIENLDKLGVPIPKFVKKSLSSAEKKIDDIGAEEKEAPVSKKKGAKRNAKSKDA